MLGKGTKNESLYQIKNKPQNRKTKRTGSTIRYTHRTLQQPPCNYNAEYRASENSEDNL